MSSKYVVVGLGEILWDVFPDGPRFGGAPANFACHAAQLGAEARMASAVGQDDLGEKAIEALQEKGVDSSCVARSEYPTGKVDVELDSQGKASYEFAADTAWDHLLWSDSLAKLAASTAAVCFGTLGQRSDTARRTIQQFVAATDPQAALRIFDINLRPPFYSDAIVMESLEFANVLKLNDEELPYVAKLCGLSGSDAELLQKLSQRFGLRLAAVTRGSDGAILCRGEEISEFPGFRVLVSDTVGAGDSFTAALAMGLLNGRELDAINQQACSIASYVCAFSGATPTIPAELKLAPADRAHLNIDESDFI